MRPPGPLDDLWDSPRLAGQLDALGASDASLLDLVDHLIDKGCVLTGEVVLGLANVDLVYVELSLLLCSVDRIAAAREPEGAEAP